MSLEIGTLEEEDRIYSDALSYSRIMARIKTTVIQDNSCCDPELKIEARGWLLAKSMTRLCPLIGRSLLVMSYEHVIDPFYSKPPRDMSSLQKCEDVLEGHFGSYVPMPLNTAYGDRSLPSLGVAMNVWRPQVNRKPERIIAYTPIATAELQLL